MVNGFFLPSLGRRSYQPGVSEETRNLDRQFLPVELAHRASRHADCPTVDYEIMKNCLRLERSAGSGGVSNFLSILPGFRGPNFVV